MESQFIPIPSLDLETGGYVLEKALVLDRTEWDRIRDHMRFLQKDAEYAEQQHKVREKTKDKSKFMTKDWDNTLQNKRGRRLAANQARLEAIEARRKEAQAIFRKEQAAEKKKYLDECQKALYYNKDNVKMLNKALLFSDVLRTREEQTKFDKKLKELDDKREQVYVEKCKKDLEEFEKEQRLQIQKKIEEQQKCKKDLLAQIEVKEYEKIEEEKEKLREREDNEAIKRELEIAEKCEQQQKAIRKENCMKDIQDNFVKNLEYREAKKNEEEVADKLINIYANAKRRMVNMQKTREKQLKEAELLKREKISNYIAGLMREKKCDEDERIKKSIAEKEAKLQKQYRKKVEHEKHLLEEKIEAYNEYLQQEKERKNQQDDMKKWEMMQRFKQNEVNKQFYKEREEKQNKEMMELRKSCDEQIKEREQVLEKAREEEVEAMQFEKLLYAANDDAFLSYADELLEDCKLKGRNTMPILRCIEDYKKKNGLNQVIRVPPSLKTNIKLGPLPEPPLSWGKCQPKSNAPCSIK